MNDFKAYIEQVKSWLIEVKNFTLNRNIEAEELTQNIGGIETYISSIEEGEITESEIITLQSYVNDTNILLTEYAVDDEEYRQLHVPIGQHKLPPLPYNYDALEPYISTEIMKLHHDKHHQAYVDGLNKAENMMKKARETNDFALLKHWEREAAFHGSGHYLHTIFWDVMSPKGGGEPKGALLQQIRKDFGSYDAFKKQFSEAAKQVEGVGWAILVWSPRSRRLEILQSERHQLLTQWDTIPLLVLDVWEHAYYLQYKNNRGEYVDNWWNIVNWPAVEERFQKAQKLQWKPY
ncbi:superoxide dismutase [Bacillus massiliigorillae]|uniref:superoxide dismutase n=1 Tax=Bacillus massiliigorillae TaxID=1243664 RepID=UPI0003A161A5|nr:superoxide dismutase [Bacillus massiliigorillae]